MQKSRSPPPGSFRPCRRWSWLWKPGVRRGELLGFFKSDFDTRRHVYSVARTVRKPRGQAPETAAPKSLSYRTNPLTDRALQAVELLRQRYPDSPYLIPGPDGGLMRPDTWSRRLKTEMDRMAQRYKDMPRLTAHELRHTHGTYLRRMAWIFIASQKFSGIRTWKSQPASMYTMN